MPPVPFILVFGLLLASAFILWQGARAKTRLRAAYPPPGRLVSLNGRRLHVSTQGAFGPSVVVLPGQGDFSLSWRHIQEELAGAMRVTLYDRAGLGWSDPGPTEATVADAVRDLHDLLRQAGVTGPHLLVGHSLGGMIARLYTHRYPNEVAGLVLVDASHEDQFAPELIQQTLKKMAWMMPVMMGAFGLLARSGLAALNPALFPDLGGALGKLDEATRQAYQAIVASRPRHLAASAAEIRNLERSNAVMRTAKIETLGDIPLIVIRHGKEQPQMGSPEVTHLLEATFAQLQAGMAKLSPRGQLWVAEDSGHAIHLDQPELVTRAIAEVAAQAAPVATAAA